MADTKAQVKAKFQELDKDKTGYLDHNEVKAALKELYSSIDLRLSDADIDQMIKQVDKDNNGKISIEEFINLI